MLQYRIMPSHPWVSLARGAVALSLALADGSYTLEARVAGVNAVGAENPVSTLPFAGADETTLEPACCNALAGALGGTIDVSLGLHLCGTCSSVAAAVHYSLDSQPWRRADGPNLTLPVVGEGKHRLLVAAESFTGNVDTHAVGLTWVAPVVSPQNRSLFLVAAPGTGKVGESFSFTVGGRSHGSFMWRLDNGLWQYATGRPEVSLFVSTPGVHHWEALPTPESDLLWQGSPLLHSWNVIHDSSSSVLHLTRLSDGAHSLLARAVDASGRNPLPSFLY